jgi:alkyldihydroxyacetonephosphate synthase
MRDFKILTDPTVDEIEIRAPRITSPASLVGICTPAK